MSPGHAATQTTPVRRILVVDDELLIRWSLCETLSDHGYTVLEAEDGQGAVRTLSDATELPDVVLLDFRLPDSTDLKLLERIIRMVPEGRVILMTAYGTPELTNEALARGAFTVLHKRFELQDVTSLVA